MSHYLHLVMVRASIETNDIEGAVKELMAPYDKSTDVEPYKIYITNTDSHWPQLDRMRENYKIAPDAPLSELIPFVNDWTHCADGCEPGVDQFGLYTWRTNNPAGRWDWWRIGGRWDGEMLGLAENPDGEGGFNFGRRYESLGRNCTKGRDILEHNTKIERPWQPYSVITPDGKWCETPAYYMEPGFFSLTDVEQGIRREQVECEWTKQVAVIMETFRDEWWVSVDYHR